MKKNFYLIEYGPGGATVEVAVPVTQNKPDSYVQMFMDFENGET